eukprot:6069661-Amphidinium_carterae.1
MCLNLAEAPDPPNVITDENIIQIIIQSNSTTWQQQNTDCSIWLLKGTTAIYEEVFIDIVQQCGVKKTKHHDSV